MFTRVVRYSIHITTTQKFNADHKLTCKGPILGFGVKQTRPWECACGAQFEGYDTFVKNAHRLHKKTVKEAEASNH